MILLGALHNKQYKNDVLINYTHAFPSSATKRIAANEYIPAVEQVLFCTTLGVLSAAWEPGNPCQLPAKKHWSSQAASCECM